MRREGPRVVALLVPELPLQRVARGRERGPEARPLAVLAEGRVLCADAAARAEGVRPGATASEALSACGRVELVLGDPAADHAALRALAEAVLGLAPAVELAGPDVLLLDASAAHLLGRGGPPSLPLPAGGAGGGADEEKRRSEEELLAARAVAAASEMGYVARAVVATGRGPARAFARHAHGPVSWIPADGSVRALAALPVAALWYGLGALPGAPDAEAAAGAERVAGRLAALGIDRAGELARLPDGTLAHRFGPAGVLAARLARGEDDSPLVPYVPETLPEEGLELEGPVESAEPLLFGLKRLADRVSARLAGRGLGATRLRLVLRLDPRGEERVQVPLASPTASPARWLLPLKEQLFSMRLPAAVVGLRLSTVEVAPVAPEQLAIGDRPEALAALEGVLARLAVRLGDGALFAAEPVDRHRPEGAYRAVPFRTSRRRGRAATPRSPRTASRGIDSTDLAPGAGAPVDAPPRGPDEAPLRPTRLLAVPAPVVAEGEGGRLTALRVDGRARTVLALDGPERLRGEWWASPFDRDYYRVRLEGVGDCWVFRDGGDGRLYLHGFFD